MDDLVLVKELIFFKDQSIEFVTQSLWTKIFTIFLLYHNQKVIHATFVLLISWCTIILIVIQNSKMGDTFMAPHKNVDVTKECKTLQIHHKF
jgi:hypothetical protein